MAVCVVLEDTMTGITSAVASRVTILAFTGSNSDDRSIRPPVRLVRFLPRCAPLTGRVHPTSPLSAVVLLPCVGSIDECYIYCFVIDKLMSRAQYWYRPILSSVFFAVYALSVDLYKEYCSFGANVVTPPSEQ